MKKKIVITGISGQDGSYMAEHCLRMEDTMVYGMVRRTAHPNDHNFRHLLTHPRLKIVRGDLLDSSSIDSLVQEIQPDYFFNFAAQSFVGDSWKIPEETFLATAVGVLRCLEAIRKRCPSCRFYNAGSSEQFGDVIYSPQDEQHPFRPRSPYGAAKCAAQHLVKVYRESYHLYAVQGMLFNHESERRGEEFVTRKITKGFARIAQAIKEGKEFEPIRLGNIDSKRDWSHAADFMDAVWRMMNQEQYNDELFNKLSGNPTYLSREPRRGAERHLSIAQDIKALSAHIKEYVIASGETHTIREFINVCCKHLGYDCVWGGYKETAVLRFSLGFFNANQFKSGILVKIDPEFYRPADVNLLMGNPAAATKDLGWKPNISFDTLAKRMLESDLHESGIVSISGDEYLAPVQTQTPTQASGPEQAT